MNTFIYYLCIYSGFIPTKLYVGSYNRLTTDLSAKLINKLNQRKKPSYIHDSSNSNPIHLNSHNNDSNVYHPPDVSVCINNNNNNNSNSDNTDNNNNDDGYNSSNKDFVP